MNNTILLDTSELIRGLESLAHSSKNWSDEKGVNRYAALRLSYNLMTRDKILYDGNVRSKNVELIDTAIEAITNNHSKDLANKLSTKIEPVFFDEKGELDLIDKSVLVASKYFDNCSKTYLSDYLTIANFEGGLTRPDKYLFRPIIEKRPTADAICQLFEDKKVTGRRFYAAIYNNPKVLDSVAKWVFEKRFEQQHYALFFTLFRSKLSALKSDQLVENGVTKECFYEPDRIRGKILSSIPEESGELPNYQKLVEESMYKVWMGKQGLHVLENTEFEIPSILNLPLKAKNKSEYLERVLSFSNTDFKKEYNKVIELMSGVRVESLDNFKQDFEIALRNARTKEIVISESSIWGFMADLQDLIQFYVKNSQDFVQDSFAGGSITSVFGALVRTGFRLMGKGVRAGTKIQKSFGTEILSMSRANRNMNLDIIFD